MLLSITQASAQEKYLTKIIMVTLVRAEVKYLHGCCIRLVSFVNPFLLACACCVVPLLSDFTELAQWETLEKPSPPAIFE